MSGKVLLLTVAVVFGLLVATVGTGNVVLHLTLRRRGVRLRWLRTGMPAYLHQVYWRCRSPVRTPQLDRFVRVHRLATIALLVVGLAILPLLVLFGPPSRANREGEPTVGARDAGLADAAPVKHAPAEDAATFGARP